MYLSSKTRTPGRAAPPSGCPGCQSTCQGGCIWVCGDSCHTTCGNDCGTKCSAGCGEDCSDTCTGSARTAQP